jgi:hypothetical protein
MSCTATACAEGTVFDQFVEISQSHSEVTREGSSGTTQSLPPAVKFHCLTL